MQPLALALFLTQCRGIAREEWRCCKSCPDAFKARAHRDSQGQMRAGCCIGWSIFNVESLGGIAFAGLAVVVLYSHLPEIMNLSDRILVCRQGRVVEEISPVEAPADKIMFAAVH